MSNWVDKRKSEKRIFHLSFDIFQLVIGEFNFGSATRGMPESKLQSRVAAFRRLARRA